MANSPSDVRYVKSTLQKKLPLYQKIRDCIEGPEAIYDGRTSYLPYPDPLTANTKEGTERYRAYVDRAIFYNITGNTVKGMLGQIYSRDPVVKMPAQLEVMTEDINGNGADLVQQSKQVVEDVIAVGRHGLLAEYPRVEGPVTREQMLNGAVRPLIMAFKPEDVINWRESLVGNRKKLSLVVIRDKSDTPNADTFSESETEVYRELRLIEGVYQSRFWIEVGGQGDEGWRMEAGEWTIPKKADGSTFDEIPFTFVGADNNDPSIDDCPMRDIVELNLGHYRNSADYEESVFMLSQPTPVIAGLSIPWVKEVLADHPIVFGSRTVIKLPAGATANLLVAPANTLASEAMDKKEKQMVSLGARIVQDRDVQRTATEYGGDKATQTSILATISRNVTSAYLKCFRWACDYSGANFDEIEFELNTDFEIAKMSPEEQAAVIASWQSKAISFTEMRFALKKGGVAFQEDEDMREEAENDPNIIKLDLANPDPNDPDADPAGNSDPEVEE